MEAAETDARRLRHETEDFLDQRLGSFEILLDKLQKTVNAGRQRLSIGALRRTPASTRSRTRRRASSTRTDEATRRPSTANWCVAANLCTSTLPSCCASRGCTARPVLVAPLHIDAR